MGRPPAKTRTFRFCPSCGTDLESLEPIRFKDLYADPLGDTYWRGREVSLTPTERILVNTLLTGQPSGGYKRGRGDRGFFVNSIVLCERAGILADSLAPMLSRIRGKFKQVDPDFDHIESDYKHGYRWSEIHIKRQIAAFYPNFVLYDNQELIWRQVYRVHLSAKESEVMRVLMEAKGEPRRWQQLDAELGFGEDNTKKLVYLLRAKFEKTDPSAKAIHSHRNEGYRLVAPNFQPALTARQHSCRRGQLARRSPTLQRETDAAKVGKR